MTCLVHARVYSGERRPSQRYAWICRACGAHGWSEQCDLTQVDMGEYLSLRVAYGWHPRLPSPPRAPSRIKPARASFAVLPMLAFGMLFAAVGVAGLPWLEKPLLEISEACIGSGAALLCWTLCYIAWKVGR
jgi:hypothetical protein